MKTEITYITGNMFIALPEEGKVMIAHCCNDIGRWGSGFVVPLGQVYPKAKEAYLQWFDHGVDDHVELPNNAVGDDFALGNVQFVTVEDTKNLEARRTVTVANMIGQKGVVGPDNPHPLDYAAIEKSIETVSRKCDPDTELHCPKFGAGLAGGDWAKIEPLIQKHWCEKGLKVTIYSI